LSNTAALGLGGLLAGFGIGWYVFTNIEVSVNAFAVLLIVIGGAIVASSLISRGRPRSPARSLVGALSGGLILALFFTSGLSIIQDILGIPGGVGPYTAEDTMSFSGAATAQSLYLKVDNVNGQVQVSTWSRSEYSVELRLRARGLSQQEADNTLRDLSIDMEEETLGGQLRLVLRYDIPTPTWRRLSIDVSVTLPEEAVTDLDLGSTNGAITLADVQGGTLNLGTTNGNLEFEQVYAESITGTTTNGRIEGVVEAADMDASTTNGVIELGLPSGRSGDYRLSTTNGNVGITVSPSQGVGYDLDLSTSNGSVDIGLSGLEYTRDTRTHKEARTVGFSGKGVQITLTASTTNGSVNVSAPASVA